MKTKVWIVIWGLKDGGAEVLARDYARLVDRNFFESTVVTMYPFENAANFRRAKEAGLRTISIFNKRNAVTRAIRVLLGKWYVPIRLKHMLKKERPDAIHINSQMANIFTAVKKQLANVNLLYTCHNEVAKYFDQKELRAVRELVEDNNMRLIALHDDMRKDLNQHFGRNDCIVIRNGVDFNNFRNVQTDKNAKRQSIGVPEDAYVVGHVGRFVKQKNHGYLLQIFQEIARRKTNAHLLLIGSGELQEEIRQQIQNMHLEERVTILSHRTDIPELLHAMDVMVFPSLYEGLSVTLVEAQASGLKCVVSDTINPASFLTENIIPVSLNDSAEIWADITFDDTRKNSNHGNLEDFDMNREICRLERLYQGELDV